MPGQLEEERLSWTSSQLSDHHRVQKVEEVVGLQKVVVGQQLSVVVEHKWVVLVFVVELWPGLGLVTLGMRTTDNNHKLCI